MPRNKEFDPDVVLDRAMELFWRNGYEATSMSDLVEHLGVGKASLYATFGGKHDLYVKALERYNEVGPSPLEILSRPGPALEAVRALVDSFAAGPQPGRPPGCMIANAAVEFYRDDVEVERRVTGSWAALEAALESTLIRARTKVSSPPTRTRAPLPASCSSCSRA